MVPWTLPACALLAFAPQAPEAPSAIARRALLVGVEQYPDATGWPRLSGPRADVEALRSVLIERCSFRASEVHTLFDAEATKEAMRARFLALAEASREGDVLLFYFAGHGSQLPDDDGDELDGWDETLIAGGAPDRRGPPGDVRDDELREWVSAANEHTRSVVLIFDCCAAGTNSRGDEGSAVRFVDPGARGVAGTRPATSAAEAGSGYFLPASSYVALGACRAEERAFETRIEGAAEPWRGLFTLCLARELEAAGPSLTYAALGDRLRAAVALVRPGQTPVVEGPLADSDLFGGLDPLARPRFDLEREGATWFVTGGAIHGLAAGDLLEVGGSDGAAPRFARVAEAGPARSAIEWLEVPAPDFDRLRAELAARAPRGETLTLFLDDALARAAFAAAFRASLARHSELDVADAVTAPVWILGRSFGGDRFACAFAREGVELELGARLDRPQEIERCVRGLERLAQARSLAAALSQDRQDPIEASAELLRSGVEGGPTGALERDSNGVYCVPSGELVLVRIVNHSPYELHASLIAIAPDGAVHIPWCSADEGVPLASGREQSLSFRMEIDRGSEGFYRAFPFTFAWILSREPHGRPNALAQPSAVAVSRGEESGSDGGVALPRDAGWTSRPLSFRVRAAR